MSDQPMEVAGAIWSIPEKEIVKEGEKLQVGESGEEKVSEEEKGSSSAEPNKFSDNKDLVGVAKKKRKLVPVWLATEVWVDVLGFVKRIQLARTVSLTNFRINEICEPRLHGSKVEAHNVREILIVSSCTQPGMALLLIDANREVPFPECPPLDYITGFEKFKIKFIDNQVLEFFKHICHRLAPNDISMTVQMEMKQLDGQQRVLVNQLHQILIDGLPEIRWLHSSVDSFSYLQNADNKVRVIQFELKEEAQITSLLKFLSTPRPDRQVRFIHLYLGDDIDPLLLSKIMNAIRREFHASTQPAPQKFHICCRCCFQFDAEIRINEENELTGETLTIWHSDEERDYIHYVIYRQLNVQHQERTEDEESSDDDEGDGERKIRDRTEIVLNIKG